jgi:aspartyl aminopeptidase
MAGEPLATARSLCAFIDRSPSPFHACAEVAAALERAGFQRLAESASWPRGAARCYVLRGGALVAWAVPEGAPPACGFRILGAHTDSPNLRIKPRPEASSAGCFQLGVEVYGGVLLNSWLDRDLGLSGRAWVRTAQGRAERLFQVQRPLLRLPQLAIHLNREVTSEGLKLNAQAHMNPLWTRQSGSARSFRAFLAEELEVEHDDVLAWDAMCHDVQPATLLGQQEEFVSAPRLDNLCSCFCALQALLARLARQEPLLCVPVLALFDHEEVGSTSSRGAQSPLLRDLLERSVLARSGTREDYHRALASSLCVSADMAHATHPNYPEKHEPAHWIGMNGGPVIKTNTNQRYASEGETEAAFMQACERADVPFQQYAHRGDLMCGTTIGPLTAASLGLRTVDVGNPQLAMHSARELCGSADPELLVRALTSFLE